MATKTAVCPECGAPAARGRYACAECGALLASVAVAPRDRSRAVEEDAGAADGTEAVAADPGMAEEPAGSSEAAAEWNARLAAARARAAAPSDAPPPGESHVADPLAFDEDLPLGLSGEVHPAPEPEVLHDLPDAPAAEEAPEPPVAPVAAFAPAGAVAVPAARSPAQPGAPSWPPPGDHGAVARPDPRTPAGAYLPPSAVLPPLDGVSAIAAAAAAPAATPDRGAAAAAWAQRGSVALSDAFQSVRITADAGRRAVAAGAGLAAIGFLLPWLNGLPNGNPFDGYLDRWGFAGPGMWLVWIGLVTLAVVAGSDGRPASWPVAVPAVAAAAFLFGLLWPYLLGGFGRSIGILVVLAGTIVLAVGGVLERRGRHDGSGPDVRDLDTGGR